MAGDKGFFVQYKFILPETIKHSHYTYQKLFRAIYGYTQKVCKSNGKSYSYHRKGLLSDTPFIKHGKNCVIIPQDAFPELKNFFQTGKNPTHQWRTKGDWKAVYYLNEKDLTEEQITKAVEDYIDRYYVPTGGAHEKLELELATFLSQQKKRRGWFPTLGSSKRTKPLKSPRFTNPTINCANLENSIGGHGFGRDCFFGFLLLFQRNPQLPFLPAPFSTGVIKIQ